MSVWTDAGKQRYHYRADEHQPQGLEPQSEDDLPAELRREAEEEKATGSHRVATVKEEPDDSRALEGVVLRMPPNDGRKPGGSVHPAAGDFANWPSSSDEEVADANGVRAAHKPRQEPEAEDTIRGAGRAGWRWHAAWAESSDSRSSAGLRRKASWWPEQFRDWPSPGWSAGWAQFDRQVEPQANPMGSQGGWAGEAPTAAAQAHAGSGPPAGGAAWRGLGPARGGGGR